MRSLHAQGIADSITATSGFQTTAFQHFSFCNSSAAPSAGHPLLWEVRASQPSGQVNCSLFSFLLYLCSCSQLLWLFPLLLTQESESFIGLFLWFRCLKKNPMVIQSYWKVKWWCFLWIVILGAWCKDIDLGVKTDNDQISASASCMRSIHFISPLFSFANRGNSRDVLLF